MVVVQSIICLVMCQVNHAATATTLTFELEVNVRASLSASKLSSVLPLLAAAGAELPLSSKLRGWLLSLLGCWSFCSASDVPVRQAGPPCKATTPPRKPVNTPEA
jgi:hypothetical protein